MLAQIAPGSYSAPTVGDKLAEDLQPASKKGRMAAEDRSKANPFAALLQFQFDLAGVLAPPFASIILPGILIGHHDGRTLNTLCRAVL